MQHLPPRNGAIMLGVPHTSNWDFILMLAIVWRCKMQVRWLGKASLFRGPAGPIMRALGGIPVERSAAHGLTDHLIAQLRSKPGQALVITPEGTRSAGKYWKSGFYRIAEQSEMPVLLGFVDRRNMTTGLGPVVNLTGDVRADMDKLREFYDGKVGIRPGKEIVPRLRIEDETAD